MNDITPPHTTVISREEAETLEGLFKKQLANRRLEHQITLKEQAQKMGVIGRFFGSTSNAALYIVSLILIICLLVLGAVVLFDPAYRDDLLKAIGGIALAAMGYIGGLLTHGR